MLGAPCSPCCGPACRWNTFSAITAVEAEYESADLLVHYDGVATKIEEFGENRLLSYTVAYRGSAINGVFSLTRRDDATWTYSGGLVAPWCGDFEGVQARFSTSAPMAQLDIFSVSAGGNITGGMNHRGTYRSLSGCAAVIGDFGNVSRRCDELTDIEHLPNNEYGLPLSVKFVGGQPQESIAWEVKEVVHASPGFYYQVGIMYYPIVKTHRLIVQY